MAKSAEPNTIVATSEVSSSFRPAAMRFVPQFSSQKRSSSSSLPKSSRGANLSRAPEIEGSKEGMETS